MHVHVAPYTTSGYYYCIHVLLHIIVLSPDPILFYIEHIILPRVFFSCSLSLELKNFNLALVKLMPVTLSSWKGRYITTFPQHTEFTATRCLIHPATSM